MTFRTRFAPSPTGPLHLGHAYSAVVAHDMAQSSGGAFLLRIEDIDRTRARAEWETQIYDDLTWLGLSWPTPVMRQSDNLPAYTAALSRLADLDVLYACACSRKDIQAALSAPQEGADLAFGPDGAIYPGTCRAQRLTQVDGTAAIRLDIARAVDIIQKQSDSRTLTFTELRSGKEEFIDIDLSKTPDTIGDIIVARRDMGTSYHLSVVVDDHAQDITHVVRGADLFEATAIHVILQQLLGYSTPRYLHHKLIRDDNGKRLAKRDDARAISVYRQAGKSPQDIRAMVGL